LNEPMPRSWPRPNRLSSTTSQIVVGFTLRADASVAEL
jgi:hypothetical protein